MVIHHKTGTRSEVELELIIIYQYWIGGLEYFILRTSTLQLVWASDSSGGTRHSPAGKGRLARLIEVGRELLRLRILKC